MLIPPKSRKFAHEKNKGTLIVEDKCRSNDCQCHETGKKEYYANVDQRLCCGVNCFIP